MIDGWPRGLPYALRRLGHRFPGPVSGTCSIGSRSPWPPPFAPPPPLPVARHCSAASLLLWRSLTSHARASSASVPHLPMRTSRLCSLWPDMRSLRFRRFPFGRDGTFDPGGATASRIAMPHILPSTVPSVSASATLFLSWLNPHPIRSLCTLRIRRRRRLRNTRFPAARYHLTGAGLSPAGTRQLRLTHRN